MPGFSGKTLSDFCPSAERGDHGIDFRGLHTFLFLLTPLGGGDPSRTSTIWPPSRFLLTPQRRGDPTTTGRPSTPTGNFYSRPRAGAIFYPLPLWYSHSNFYSRPRAGAIPGKANDAPVLEIFLLTPPGGGDRQSSTKQISCSAANCRKITCFFMGSASHDRKAPPKTAQSAGIDRADLP